MRRFDGPSRDAWIRLASAASSLLAVVLTTGCGSLNQVPDAGTLRAIKSIEVLIEVPPNTFAYEQATPVVLGLSPPALAATAINAIVAHAKAATAREAEVPVGNLVADIDLRRTVMAELARVREESVAAPSLSLSDRRIGTNEVMSANQCEAALIELAKSTPADATLLVRVFPWFQTRIRGLPIVYSSALLLDRSGKEVMSIQTEFVGPASPDGDVVQWWADQRYRRFVLLGVRVGMLTIADALWKAPQSADQVVALEAKLRLMSNQTSDGLRLRADACALDSPSAKVRYRFERQRYSVLAVGLCEGSEAANLAQQSSRDVSWLSDVQPSLAGPALRPATAATASGSAATAQ